MSSGPLFSMLVAVTLSVGCGGSAPSQPRYATGANDDYTPEARRRPDPRSDEPVLLAGALEISTGGLHSCARTDRGLFCWGNNDYGQLGDGTTAQRVAPVRVDGIDVVEESSAGHFHTCARMRNRTLTCWGMNSNGQLGAGDGHPQRDRPVPVVSLDRVTGLASAVDGDHTCATRDDGSVWCWGSNNNGEVGDGTRVNRSEPVQVQGLGGAVRVSLGQNHSCAIVDGGRVWCWGQNTFGQLGDGTTEDRLRPVPVPGLVGVEELTAGQVFTCARQADGTVWCWGLNDHGELGDGTMLRRPRPVQVRDLADAIDITAGTHHACARTGSGEVYCWGDNEHGQLGDGTTEERHRPHAVAMARGATAISASTGHTCAIDPETRVLCWGNNSGGQLGDATTSHRSLPVAVLAGEQPDAPAVAAATPAAQEGAMSVATTSSSAAPQSSQRPGPIP